MSERIAQPINGSYGSINGEPVTEKVIERLVQHAEAGYPGAEFKRPGRPSRTDEPTRAVSVRLTESEIEALMARAARENQSRAQAMRAAITEWSRKTA